MGLRRSLPRRRTSSMRPAAWATLLAPSLVVACSVINAPDEVQEVPGAGGSTAGGGSDGLGGTAGSGGSMGLGGTSTTSAGGSGGSGVGGSGGSSGNTTSGGAGGTPSSGGAGGSSTTGAGGEPVTFDEGLVVVSARTAEGPDSEQVLAILSEDGSELDRETVSVAAIAHDGAAERDVWFVFVAEDIFPIDRTRPADLEVRRYNPDGPGWTVVSEVTALPPPRAGHIAVLNGYLAYLSYRNSDEAETLTILDTRDLEDIKKLPDNQVPEVLTGVNQSLLGLLGARGSPTNRRAVGGTLNVMIGDCTRTECPLIVQPLFIGSQVTAGTAVDVAVYNGTPAFASALTERRSFVSMSTADEGARLFEFDPFDVSDVSDSPVATTTTTMNGLAILECESALVLSEGEEARLRGVSLTGNVGQGYALMRPGQELYFEPYTRRLLAPYNEDIAVSEPEPGFGSIDAFTLKGNGVSAPTITPVAEKDWAPPDDLVPLTMAVRMPPTFSCD